MKISEVINKQIKGLWGTDFSDIENGTPVIKTNNMTYEGVIDYSDICYRNIRKDTIGDNYLQKGDLLVEKSGGTKTHSVGYVNFFDGDNDIFVCNNFIIGLRPNNEIVDSKYLFYQLRYMYECGYFSDCYNKTTGIQNLKANQYLGKNIRVECKNRQKSIADELDGIVEAINLKRKEVSFLDELVKSRFIEMFGDPRTNSKKLPELTLPELGEFGRGVSKHRPRNAPELLGGRYPLIQTGEVANAELYINEYTNTYSELGYKQSKMWKAGTLCITIAANIAKTGILSFDACFPDSVVGFLANEKTNNIFIHFWFSFFQEILEAQAPASAQKNINLRILRELKVIVPPIELQNEFAEFVKLTDKSKFVYQFTLSIFYAIFLHFRHPP